MSSGAVTGRAGTGRADVIRLDAVSYAYPGPPVVEALKHVDLRVRGGDHLALTGPSGSGKSTLLNLLGLLDRPTQGRIEVDGLDMSQASERDRTAVRARRIGFVFQSFHLLPHRTALENVTLAEIYADVPRRQRAGRAMAALWQVGLGHRAQALPTALSGGERQRVAIARALVNHPALLLCDEPTGNLDTANTEELLDLLGQLHHGGMTLAVVTHNPAVAGRAHRQLTIRDGLLTEQPAGQAALTPGRHPPGPARGEEDGPGAPSVV
jgi:putative ABC transport system ATP-binding protein